MKSKVIILLTTIVGLSTIVFVVAFLVADKTRYHNDFTRVFPPHAADESKNISLDLSASIAGVSPAEFYLRHDNGLEEISFDMLDRCLLQVEKPNEYTISVDYPYFTIQNGPSGIVQIGNTKNWLVDTTFTDLPPFIAAQPISKDVFVLQVVNMSLRKNVFIKSTHLDKQQDILKKQIDGIFCTDGFLMFAKKLNIIVYAYRYRNEIICMDTSLNMIRTFHTIDTTSTAKIEVAEIDGKITMSKPPFVVNKGASIDGSHLFVHSNLVAKNESIEDVKDKSVIDVYDVNEGSYMFSFYVPSRGKHKMESFRVKDSILIAKFGNEVVRYDLGAKYLR